MKIDLSNLFQIDPLHGLSLKEIESKKGLLGKYLKNLKAKNQGFYSIIDDHKMVQEIERFAKSHQKEFKDIVILGIGGSALGPFCLRQSLGHLFENSLKEKQFPRLFVLDNIDPALISEIEDVIDYKTTLFITITKSGTTPETLSQFLYFKKRVSDQKLEIKKHFVFITDPKKGFLRKIAYQENITVFSVPPNVGGRFSVLTPVGLLPAKLLGVNIKNLLAGAKKMRNNFLSQDFNKNIPFQIATIQYLLFRKEKTLTY